MDSIYEIEGVLKENYENLNFVDSFKCLLNLWFCLL